MSNMLLQVGVKAFLKNKEGKYLLVRRNAEKYGKTSGSWDIPGGRIDPGTSLVENLRREVKEETGLKIISEPILISAQDIMPNTEWHIVRLTYIADTDGEPQLDLAENTEYLWCTVEQLTVQDGLDTYVREVIEKGLIQ
jgi:8-oxo-dGTP diphosphatase